jgi:ABC-type antimicrobial peptide transport system permease subunit
MILRKIEKEERRKTFRQMIVSGVLLVASFAASALSMMDLGTRLSESGFFSFISLFGSDFSFAMANGRELFFSLTESFPAISAAFCIASIAFVVWFGMRLTREAGTIRRNKFAMRYS